MKEYFIDFQGYCRIEANSEQEAQEKFYDKFYGTNELFQENSTVEVYNIVEHEEEEED